jgi:glutathione S-transferase
MKLYFTPGTCALATHIALAESGTTYETEQVNLKNKTCPSGDYTQINKKGSVPALKMSNGEILTEVAVVLQYIADQKPESALIPKAGTTERYRAQEWLNYISSEVHKAFNPFFVKNGMFDKNPEAMTEFRNFAMETLATRFNYISEKLGKNDYLMGKNFTVADAYLFTVMNWGKFVNFDFSKWSNLTAYQTRIYQRAGVQKALKEEGLLN